MFRLGYFILLLFTANTKISCYFHNTKIKAVKTPSMEADLIKSNISSLAELH